MIDYTPIWEFKMLNQKLKTTLSSEDVYMALLSVFLPIGV